MLHVSAFAKAITRELNTHTNKGNLNTTYSKTRFQIAEIPNLLKLKLFRVKLHKSKNADKALKNKHIYCVKVLKRTQKKKPDAPTLLSWNSTMRADGSTSG